MFNGVGFFEIVVIVLLILVFFGSKELPQFVREAAKFIGNFRRYSDMMRRQMDEIVRLDDKFAPVESHDEQVRKQKEHLRQTCMQKCMEITESEVHQKSQTIWEHFKQTESFQKAQVICLYFSTQRQVSTEHLIQELFTMRKRVVIAYHTNADTELSIAEITNIQNDCIQNANSNREPASHLRGNFLKSDLQLIVCPAVGFDKKGGRLGMGRATYDYFLKDLKDRIPCIGVAFQCQILENDLPFAYHDVPMDMVITEEGVIFKAEKITSISSSIVG